MSISLYWKPTTTKAYLKTPTPSNLKGILEAAFGEMPIELSETNLNTLKALAMASDDEKDGFEELIDAIEEHETIIVSFE